MTDKPTDKATDKPQDKPDAPVQEPTAEEKKAQANTKKVVDFLNENNLDVGSQLLLVLQNGQKVPIQGITTQAFVAEKEKPAEQPVKTDEPQQQTNSDSGKVQE